MKKNVLFILTDDQRFNTIHALGNPDIQTPNLDRLVREGMAFTHAHIPGGTSGAVCMPSRAMLNTGRTLFHLQGEGQDIPTGHTTMGELFRQNGYRCFGTGKWHNGTPAYARSFTEGDNAFFGGMWDHWNVPVCRYDPTGAYDNVVNFVVNFFSDNNPMKIHCDTFHPGVHSSTLLTDTAIHYLENRQEEAPFFLYLAYLAPHDPRTMPERFKKMYDPKKLTLPASCLPSHPFPFGVEEIRDEVLAASPRKEEEVRRHLAEYYGMISHLDAEIGRLLQTLEERGLLEDTLIVFTGDNGLAVGCHGLMGKQNLYDHSLRVPLILRGPGVPAGQQSDALVYLLDIFPTLCDLCGLPIPASVEGKSFAHLLQNPGAPGRESLYFAYNQLLRGVRDQRYKLIEYRCFAHETQLFDLWQDPSELHNLAADPAYAETLARLRQLLLQYRDSWECPDYPYTKQFWAAFS